MIEEYQNIKVLIRDSDSEIQSTLWLILLLFESNSE